MGKTIEFTVGEGESARTISFDINEDMEPHLNWTPASEGKKSQAEVFASFASQLGFENSTQVLEDPDLKRRWKEIVLNEGTAAEQRFMSVRDVMNRMNERVRDQQNQHTQEIMRAEDREATDDQLRLSVQLKAQCEDAGLIGMANKLGESIGVVDGATLFGINGRAMKLLNAHRAATNPPAPRTQGAPTTEPSTETTAPSDQEKEPF